MKDKKVDRRVKYTKMMLKESLIQLLQIKSIDKITIKEICELADINRSTFYSHYTDQHDLINQVQQELLKDINEYLDNYNFKGPEAESFQMIVSILEYIVANAELCKVLLGKNGNRELQKEIMMLVQEQALREVSYENNMDEETIEYYTLFAVNGSIGIIQKWLQDNMKKSAREMAEMITKLIFRGVYPTH
ncbi:TetR/AcrR family transcriptional regulator [Alkaliphilus transvaalensis]|uniref:TetR/AcrR family transcriptional regulator n=1 Tax=Alkaliphilus transvaalensis TaxID=114628 RepID=UPI00047BFC6C|nr:TetR/AcrR family transcriptional regulator C-terminal domain-containing protein [Alkaliphilus transvaalensis]